MDLITQGILGAAIGQVGFQRDFGKKALVYGTFIGMLPDADVLSRLSSDMCAEMLHHRGITHSLFFAPVVSPIMAHFLNKIHKSNNFSAWLWLCFWALITHPLLDVFTVYGTQLLAPFSTHRFSFCAIHIVDLFYSIPLLLSVIIGFFIKKNLRFSQILSAIMLLLTSCYLFTGIILRDLDISYALKKFSNCRKIESFPIGNFWRKIVVEEDQRIHIAFRGIVTGSSRGPLWHTFEKADVSKKLMAKREVKIFYWFTDGWVLPVCEGNSLMLRDIRFGGQKDILGYWGLEVDSDNVRWKKFTPDISIKNIKKAVSKIFNTD